jgi:hypothetical protein
MQTSSISIGVNHARRFCGRGNRRCGISPLSVDAAESQPNSRRRRARIAIASSPRRAKHAQRQREVAPASSWPSVNYQVANKNWRTPEAAM